MVLQGIELWSMLRGKLICPNPLTVCGKINWSLAGYSQRWLQWSSCKWLASQLRLRCDPSWRSYTCCLFCRIRCCYIASSSPSWLEIGQLQINHYPQYNHKLFFITCKSFEILQKQPKKNNFIKIDPLKFTKHNRKNNIFITN